MARQLPIRANGRAERIEAWPRGVGTALFSPARRSTRFREEWGVTERRPAAVMPVAVERRL